MTATAMPSMAAGGGYPVGLQVDPPAGQNRLSVLLRILYVIPALIFVAVVAIIAEILALIAWFAIVITGKLPSGLGDFITNALHAQTRVMGYEYLLTDKYPPFALGASGDYPIRAQISTQVDGRNRLTVFFRMVMIIPHAIALYVVGIVACVVLFIAWFAALFTGSVPQGMHNFLEGTARWATRVSAYALLLVDDYPPFGFN